MPSSVTIPDKLRKKLKKLAAELDTTQAEIIKQAIEQFENRNNLSQDFEDPEVILLLKSTSESVHKQNSNRKRRSKILGKNRSLLDQITPANWSNQIED